jgi:hypothetical protein
MSRRSLRAPPEAGRDEPGGHHGPEALKPRRIDISSQGGRTAVGQDNRPEQIEGSANAA